MAIVLTSDFETGEKYIPQDSFTESNLEQYIEDYTKHYLQRLLGINLYNLFVADLTGTPEEPQSARFLAIFNEISADVQGSIVSNNGLKEALKGLINFHYIRDEVLRKTKGGLVDNQNENGVKVNALSSNIVRLYNKAVTDLRVIQWYIEENSSTYPEYNGQCIEFVTYF